LPLHSSVLFHQHYKWWCIDILLYLHCMSIDTCRRWNHKGHIWKHVLTIYRYL